MKWMIPILMAAACQQGQSASSGSGAGSSAPAPAAGKDDMCSHVGEGVRKVWNKQMAEAPSEEVKRGIREVGDRAVARLERHCRDDHWSAPTIDCVRSGGRDCQGAMTPEQWQKLQSDPIK